MEIDDYRTIMTVVETGSFIGAAEKLHRVPSALSIRVRSIEKELGCILFVRAGRGIEPTGAALELASAAKEILALSKSAISRVTSSQPGGLLRIGALDSFSGTRLPKYLSSLVESFPALELAVDVDISSALLDGVLSGKLDAALFIDAPVNKLLYRKTVFKEHLSLVACAKHPPIHSPSDLCKNTLIAFSSGCSYRERILEWFQLFDKRPDRIIEVKSYAALTACVAAGMGVAVMPDSLITSTCKDSLSVHSLPDLIAQASVEFIRLAALETKNIQALEHVLFEKTAPSE